eukprot:gene1663-1852_t
MRCHLEQCTDEPSTITKREQLLDDLTDKEFIDDNFLRKETESDFKSKNECAKSTSTESKQNDWFEKLTALFPHHTSKQIEEALSDCISLDDATSHLIEFSEDDPGHMSDSDFPTLAEEFTRNRKIPEIKKSDQAMKEGLKILNFHAEMSKYPKHFKELFSSSNVSFSPADFKLFLQETSPAGCPEKQALDWFYAFVDEGCKPVAVDDNESRLNALMAFTTGLQEPEVSFTKKIMIECSFFADLFTENNNNGEQDVTDQDDNTVLKVHRSNLRQELMQNFVKDYDNKVTFNVYNSKGDLELGAGDGNIGLIADHKPRAISFGSTGADSTHTPSSLGVCIENELQISRTHSSSPIFAHCYCCWLTLHLHMQNGFLLLTHLMCHIHVGQPVHTQRPAMRIRLSPDVTYSISKIC